MCGRYTFFRLDGTLVKRVYDLPDIDWDALDLRPRYNAAPTQMLPIVTPAAAGGRQLVMAQWGYIPPWSDTRYPKLSTINAKAEGLAESRLWASPLKKPLPGERGRCLVLCDGFYEWQKTGGAKQPLRLRRPDNAPFAFAGLYGTWTPPGGADTPVSQDEAGRNASPTKLLSFTIVTCAPNAFMARIHHRMAVILDPEAAAQWLDCEAPWEECAALCRPCADDLLVAEPVSTLVNSPKNDVPECVTVVG